MLGSKPFSLWRKGWSCEIMMLQLVSQFISEEQLNITTEILYVAMVQYILIK